MRIASFRPHCLITMLLLLLVMLLGIGCRRSPAREKVAPMTWTALIDSANSYSFHVFKGKTPICSTGLTGWGPHWAWFGIDADVKGTEHDVVVDKPLLVQPGQSIDCSYHAWQSGANTVSFQYVLRSQTAVPLTVYCHDAEHG